MKSSAGGLTGKSGAGGGKSSAGKSFFGSTANKTSSSSPKSSNSNKPVLGTNKPSTGLAPSTSNKYDIGVTPKSGKQSSSFGILWIPSKKRGKQKDLAYSAVNNDKKRERSPSMYGGNYMSGDSQDLQFHKKKEEEASLLAPERLKGPIATAASAGTATSLAEAHLDAPDQEHKLLKYDNEDSKEAAGDTKDDILENKDTFPKSRYESKGKATDKVDSVYITHQVIKVPPPSTTPVPEEEDCGMKCLYYTLLCCDCTLM